MNRISELLDRYGSDAALGIVYDEEVEASLLPDGGRASSCSDCATYIASLEATAVIYGFWSRDNPAWAGAGLVDGHDFVVVDGRYIVDPWIVETEALSPHAVFDLENPADAADITRIYGNRLAWTRASPVPPAPRNSSPVWSRDPSVITEESFLLSTLLD